MIGGMGSTRRTAHSGKLRPKRSALENGVLADTVCADRSHSFEIDAIAFRLTMDRVGDMVKLGQAHPAVSSLLKYYGTELNKRRMELVMSAGGYGRTGMGRRAFA